MKNLLAVSYFRGRGKVLKTDFFTLPAGEIFEDQIREICEFIETVKRAKIVRVKINDRDYAGAAKCGGGGASTGVNA